VARLACDRDDARHELCARKPPEARLQRRIGQHTLAEPVERLGHATQLDTVSARAHDPDVKSAEEKGFSRGRFLTAGAVAAASAGLGSVAQAAENMAGSDGLFYLRRQTYEPLVNTTFTLQHPHGPVRAQLLEVANITARGAHERRGRECFALLFEAARGEPLPQGTYGLEHPSLPGFSLFLVPVGRGEKGFYLEAVVNRFAE
jgi:hypothetical protein